ncbi:DUF2971 domain-containing protein [Clostridium botulinum]|uniref:DUF2971 domain-containing protein n=1 Tax=Clostridium botulinum TaxID=1491 RepID=UPI0004D4A0FE|nr:DUF2971 domain-containing protein [Clostridium botulinum]KEH94193.1 hypothetical protein Z963_10960 [Clostridium botulinum C/D str. It1]
MRLYHYCSEETFKSIIKSKKLWLTPVRHMNDSQEIIHTYLGVWKDAKEEAEKYYNNDEVSEILKLADEQIFGIDKYVDMPYCNCLSCDGDLYSQWTRYADDAQGFSIGFKSEILGLKNDLPHPNAYIENSIGVGEVIYSYDKQKKIILDIIHYIVKTMKMDALAWLTLRTNVKVYSAIFKNQYFLDERERRIIYYAEKDHNFNDKFVNGPFEYRSRITNEMVERYELNWYHSNDNHAIEKIYVGSKNKFTNIEIINLLFENNITIKEENIVRSKIPYR